MNGEASNNLVQPQLIRELVALLGPKAVLSQAEDLMLYEYDGSVELGSPECVVFPTCTSEVAEIVKLANRFETPLVGRGAGTGLSGGAISRNGGIVIGLDLQDRKGTVKLQFPQEIFYALFVLSSIYSD